MKKEMFKDISEELNGQMDPARASAMQRFFKTGPGQYGEGDIFIGLTVPQQRAIAKKYQQLPLSDIKKLLQSKVHEYRLTGLLILVSQFEKGNLKEKENRYQFYLENINRVNNWDLVDLTAPKIVGSWLVDENRAILYKFARSKNLWERRISIISTLKFIQNNDFSDNLKISEILINDSHDLIQKAVGWMLREVGKKDQKVEEEFLKKHYQSMPRTMLRYAIERFEPKKREFYMGRS